MNTEKADKVLAALMTLGIDARKADDLVAVSRDSMCNCATVQRPKGGIPETTVYPAVLSAVKESTGISKLVWIGKTDEDLFMDTLLWD